MEKLDYWRLVNQLTAEQAALLILGHCPAGVYCDIETWSMEDIPDGFLAILEALRQSMMAGTLTGTIRRKARDVAWIEAPSESEQITLEAGSIQAFYTIEPDWEATRIDVASLKLWLQRKNVRSDFFFPDATEAADYLNHDDPWFSSKLFAAIDSWKTLKREPQRLMGTSPKTALMDWLTEHAMAYGITNDGVTPNKSGIEDIAKVANWNTKGGANKTPA